MFIKLGELKAVGASLECLIKSKEVLLREGSPFREGAELALEKVPGLVEELNQLIQALWEDSTNSYLEEDVDLSGGEEVA